jgi:hypothetical protein
MSLEDIITGKGAGLVIRVKKKQPQLSDRGEELAKERNLTVFEDKRGKIKKEESE